MLKDRVANTLVIALGVYLGMTLFALTLQKAIEAKLKESGATGAVNTAGNISSLFQGISALIR